MGFLDLSMSVASKKHVDFSDARYQSVDRLKRNLNQKARATFTLYDNKEHKKTAVQEISAAYALSDKRIPVGELLNKMVDLIVDLEDGLLDKEKDAIYAWKYAVTLVEIYEDKVKRQESLSMFDNSLKSSIINSKTFIERYPGKYTNRTNFFSKQVKDELSAHVLETFKDVAIPAIYQAAINQSNDKAEKHSNPILDKIVQWAIDNYDCKADSFYQINKDSKTGLFYSTNTIIIHLKNGYDMSIVGYVGTEFDDKFAVSIFDAQKIVLEKHNERVSQEELRDALIEASGNDPINPLSQLLDFETRKNNVLIQQYDILTSIRPMIPEDVLKLKAAESVVGKDYIWGCEQFRTNHQDLPADFKLEDVKLPQFDEDENQKSEMQRKQEVLANVEKITDSMTDAKNDIEKESENRIVAPIIEEKQEENHISKYGPELPKQTLGQETECKQTEGSDASVVDNESVDTDNALEQNESAQESLSEIFESDLFEIDETPKEEEKKFGDPSRVNLQIPMLNQYGVQASGFVSSTKKQKFDPLSTLLPGAEPIKKPQQEYVGPSITQDAKPMPVQDVNNGLLWKDEVENEQPVKQNEINVEAEKEIKQPDLILDDLDSLFN